MESIREIEVHCPQCGRLSGWVLSCDIRPMKREDLLCYRCRDKAATEQAMEVFVTKKTKVLRGQPVGVHSVEYDIDLSGKKDLNKIRVVVNGAEIFSGPLDVADALAKSITEATMDARKELEAMKKPVEYSIMRCLHCDTAVEVGDEAPGFRSYCRKCARAIFGEQPDKRSMRGVVDIGNVTCAKHGGRLLYYLALDVPCAEPPGHLTVRVEPCPVCLNDARDDAERRHP